MIVVRVLIAVSRQRGMSNDPLIEFSGVSWPLEGVFSSPRPCPPRRGGYAKPASLHTKSPSVGAATASVVVVVVGATVAVVVVSSGVVFLTSVETASVEPSGPQAPTRRAQVLDPRVPDAS